VDYAWSLTDVDDAGVENEETAQAVTVLCIVVDACAAGVAYARVLAV